MKQGMIRFLLAAAVILELVGYSYRFSNFSNKSFSFLWQECGVSTEHAQVFVNISVLLLVAGALGAALSLRWRRFIWLLVPATLLLFFECFAHQVYIGSRFHSIAWLTWGVRLATPVALIVLVLKRWDSENKVFLLLLKYGLVFTFLGHGFKAILSDAQFIDYIMVFSRKYLDTVIREDSAKTVLHIIGTVDILLAHHLAFYNTRRMSRVIIYIAAWGFITAMARVTYSNFGAWHEVLIRAPHYLAPLALWVAYKIRVEQKIESEQ